MRMPPDLATLRALVRGALPAADRYRVERWLVEHADESVASALDALSVEWREAQADTRLPEPLRALSAALWPLVENGLGDVDPEVADAVAIMRASPPVSVALSVVLVPPHPRRVRVHARVASPGPVVVATSDDAGAIYTLFVGRADAGSLPISHDYDVAVDDGRVTFWLLMGALAAPTPEALLALVEEGTSGGSARAVRITSAFFEP